MARVLITGGSGFLGSSLALRHLSPGDQVVAVARKATDAEPKNADDMERPRPAVSNSAQSD
jgi:nucleoside-diphosphate-sugar epimerase